MGGVAPYLVSVNDTFHLCSKTLLAACFLVVSSLKNTKRPRGRGDTLGFLPDLCKDHKPTCFYKRLPLNGRLYGESTGAALCKSIRANLGYVKQLV
ncbi:unnamed protein product [Chondrus crispus]|uniref:Uncharacterized protein n=1 Tax=Chondrus crispus TaxID=2769 RepID=R7QVC9_CHOCR|nr:unnamed protein product [Chondrus crispus]CDF41300.1 unnamed protein product [Chondrus crispus]|eukprot:XP_005711594.1 unnamed protein product [Chondrus crispus]